MHDTTLRTIVVLLVLGVVGGAPVWGQSNPSVRVTAEAAPMRVQPDEQVSFTIRVQGASATVVQTPAAPSAVNLALDRRSPSTQHSTSGGVAYTWQFRPQRAGTARIRPAAVVIRGETYRTEEIRIQVTQPPKRPSTPTLTRPEASAGGSTTLDSRDLFIRATASSPRAYRNEQVIVEYRLFYRPGIRLRHSRLADAWDAQSFWREELDVASRPVPRTRQAFGQSYETIVLKRVALFPTRPGTLHVDPLRIETEAQGTVPRRRGPAVRSGFEPVRLASRALTVRVRDLPESPPPSFEGAVGQFGMSVRTDADTVAVGNAVRVMIQIRGTGNLATLSPPDLDVPAAFESYDPSVETNVDRSGRQIGGTKTFTYTLVPRSGGRHDLPPVTFSFFDPERGRYETLRSELPELHVPGTAAAPARGRTANGLPVADITGLMAANEGGWVRTDRRPLHRRPWVYVVLILPLLGAVGGVLYRRRRQNPESRERTTPDDALATAQGQLREARQRVRNGGARSVAYDAAERALFTFLQQRLGRNGAGTSRAALDRPLARRNVPEDLRDALYDVLDRCEEAQFAPDPAQASPKALLDEAESVLRRLDDCL